MADNPGCDGPAAVDALLGLVAELLRNKFGLQLEDRWVGSWAILCLPLLDLAYNQAGSALAVLLWMASWLFPFPPLRSKASDGYSVDSCHT